jgi:hypothetical protein
MIVLIKKKVKKIYLIPILFNNIYKNVYLKIKKKEHQDTNTNAPKQNNLTNLMKNSQDYHTNSQINISNNPHITNQ